MDAGRAQKLKPNEHLTFGMYVPWTNTRELLKTFYCNSLNTFSVVLGMRKTQASIKKKFPASAGDDFRRF